MNNFDSIEFAVNPDPRCPCILLLDTSSSMSGTAIDELNEGLQVFQKDVQEDNLARRRVEVAIITFGNRGVQLIQDFVTADQFQAPVLSVGANTPMGEAVNLGIDVLNNRKALYRANGIQYYRPWIFMVSDGQPTDPWESAAQRVHAEENAKGLEFFAVAVAGANIDILSQFSSHRRPLPLKGYSFCEMFKWLSQSQRRVSASKVGEQTSLPSVSGWAVV